jgi:hypothetical protein
MATARKVVPDPQPVDITLTLSAAEAELVKTLCGIVIGPLSGPRGLTSDVWQALNDIGVKDRNVQQLVSVKESRFNDHDIALWFGSETRNRK